MSFGKKDGKFFVNSGHGINRSWVEENIPTADAQGAVSVDFVQKSLKLDDSQIDGTLLGNVAIRRYIEDEFGYKKVRANQLIDEMDFLGTWCHRIPHVQANLVDGFITKHIQQAKNAHTKELSKGRTKRWPTK